MDTSAVKSDSAMNSSPNQDVSIVASKGRVESVEPIVDHQDTQTKITAKDVGDKERGSYNRSHCGVPKKGHVCPYQPKVKRRPLKPEDSYKTCDFCGRKFCENAFDRHVEFCKEKNNRITTSPVKDVVAQAKLIARTKYNPKEEAKKSE